MPRQTLRTRFSSLCVKANVEANKAGPTGTEEEGWVGSGQECEVVLVVLGIHIEECMFVYTVYALAAIIHSRNDKTPKHTMQGEVANSRWFSR